ncbi:MAG: macro domain-containing protein [Nitrospiraceae bacterium]
MPIKDVTGDILLSKAGAIAHGVAPMDDFKQGLALSLREHWPGMYKDFRHYCQSQSPKAGTVWAWKGPGTPVIFSLLTQEAAPHGQGHPGKATVPQVNHALHALKKEIQGQDIKSLAITKVSTGVGGLKWEEVQPLIKQILGDLKIPVYVYTGYKKGVAAEEA